LSLILDVGCGETKLGTIGVDIRKTPAVDLICDAHHLPFVAGVFDGCHAHALLEHVNNPTKVLKEINRVLRNHKWLRVLVPTDSRLRSDYVTDILSFDFGNLVKQYHAMKSGVHKWQYEEPSLKTILTLTGFKVEKIEYPPKSWVSGRKGRLLTKMKIVRHPHLVMFATKE